MRSRTLAFFEAEGQTMAEYAVVLGVISLIVFTAFGLLSTAISNAILTPLSAL